MKKDTLVFTNDLGYGKDKGSFEYKSFVQPSVISEVIQSGLDPVDADNEEAVKNTVDNLLNELDVTINSKGFNDAENNQKEFLVGNAASTSTLRKQTFDVFKLEKKYNTDMALILPLSIAAAKVVQKAYAEGKDIFKGLSADIDLFTALPITQLGTRDTSEKIKSAYAERFTTDNHVVQINTFNKTISVTLTFNKVYVLKEGEIATVLAIKYGPDELKQAIMEDVKKHNPTRIDDAKDLIENPQNVLGIDIGQGTTDCPLIMNGKTNIDASNTISFGYGQVLENGYRYFNKMSDSFNVGTLSEFDDILNSDSENKNDIANQKIVQKAVNASIPDLNSEISRELSQILHLDPSLKVIFVFGGGSIPLMEQTNLRKELQKDLDDYRSSALLIWVGEKYAPILNNLGLEIYAKVIESQKKQN